MCRGVFAGGYRGSSTEYFLKYQLFGWLICQKVYLQSQHAINGLYCISLQYHIDFFKKDLVPTPIFLSKLKFEKWHYSGTSLQRTCFIADTSLQRKPFPGTNWLQLWSNPYILNLFIADTLSENQWCPLLRGFTVDKNMCKIMTNI